MPEVINHSATWLDAVRGNDSYREVARRSGIAQGTLTRQLNADALTYESVRAISRAYDRPVLADLVVIGHLSPEDIGGDRIENALRAASDEQLVVEVGRRLGVVELSALFDTPVSSAVRQAGEIVHARFGAEDPKQDDEPAAAKRKSRDRGEDPEAP